MRTLRSGRSVAALVGLIAITGATGLTSTSAAVQEVTVVGVTFTPSEVDVTTGFAAVAVDLALQSDEPMDDSFGSCELDGSTVYAAPVEGSRPWAAPGEALIGRHMWRGPVTRVSGTSTDGIWRTTTEVSPAYTGSWTVNRFADPFNCLSTIEVGPSGVLTVGSPERPPWQVTQAPLTPIRVVTGAEVWTPRVRVTDRLTGAGVPAFMQELCDVCINFQFTRVGPGNTFPRASSSGYWNSYPRAVNDPPSWPGLVLAWGKRGTRGYSVESQGCFAPWVKWQANERVAMSGRTVTITGNAFPAPSIYRAANPWIRLQVLTNGQWTNVSSAVVRDNGRYTLVWTAPSAGTFQVRAYKPGGVVGCRMSAGTVLSAVGVAVS